MKRYLPILLLIFSFNSIADLINQSCADHVSFGRNGQDLYISAQDFLDNTGWMIEQGEPPVSVGGATNIVTSYLNQKHLTTDLSIAFVHLKSESCIIDGAMNTVWFYVFALDKPQILLGISMTGRLIEPKTENK